MITAELLPHLKRFAQAYQPRMLMLGAQRSTMSDFPTARSYFGQWVGDEYDELDLDGGDLRLDLNADLKSIARRYATVFNLGTVEHTWDLHRAWSNALRAVEIGGSFLTHSPVGGWVDAEGQLNHGLHQTLAAAIVEFVAKNGFEIEDRWGSQLRDRGAILWLRATKRTHIEKLADFAPVMQAYVRGKRPERPS